jgi:hypothetical protein
MRRSIEIEYPETFANSWDAGQIESNYDEITDSFDAMNLKGELLRGMLGPETVAEIEARLTDFQGVYAYGFERPSAIQQRAIMPVIKGSIKTVDPMRKIVLANPVHQARMSSLKRSRGLERQRLSQFQSSKKSTPSSRPVRL